MRLTEEQLKKALNSPAPKFSTFDFGIGCDQFIACMDLLSLILHDYDADINYPEKTTVRYVIKRKIENLFINNNAPAFDNSYNWSYAALAQSIMLIKANEGLWELFDQEGKDKLTFIMKMFALMWNHGCSGYNDFRTGIGLHGTYSKNANPNFILCNNALIIYCTEFFGGLDKLSELFTTSNYEDIIRTLQMYKFYNAHKTWTTSGLTLDDGTVSAGARELFNGSVEDWVQAYINDGYGNILYAGRGKGCKVPYLYRITSIEEDIKANYPVSVINYVIDKTFSGGICVDSLFIDTEENFSTYLKSGIPSPYLGQEGMMLEFNGVDTMGTRSSGYHSQIDFYLIAAMILSLKEMGRNVLDDVSRKNKCLTGMNDCLHKLNNQYVGYSMGKIENNTKLLNLNAWINAWADFCIDREDKE